MGISAGIMAVGSLGSAALGYMGSKTATEKSTDVQMALGQQSIAAQQGMFNQVMGTLSPIIGQGRDILGSVTGTPLSTLMKLLTPGPSMTSTLSQIPGFQFAQDWGQKAVQNIGTTQGLGGNTLKAGADYATGIAQQGYGNIVNSLISAITGVGGIGANLETGAAGALAGEAGATGRSIGSTLSGLGQSIGQTQAQGALGQSNALAGGLTGTSNAITTTMLLNKLLGNSASMYGSAGAS